MAIRDTLFPNASVLSEDAITLVRPEDPKNNFPPSLTRYASKEMVYNSYSGCDITAQIMVPGEPKPMILGELSTISYSIHRENTPVRFLGFVNVKGFLKGERTIAGSMIFTVFDTYAFYRLSKFQKMVNNGVYPLSDMLPPFDIILSFSNEYGMVSKMRIYGCTIIDEGGTMSVDDLVTESTITYMARGIQPLMAYQPDGMDRYQKKEYVSRPNIIDFGAR